MTRRRPGTPNAMWSDLPSHVMSVRRTINATSAIVRRRGTVRETYSPDAGAARQSPSRSRLASHSTSSRQRARGRGRSRADDLSGCRWRRNMLGDRSEVTS